MVSSVGALHLSLIFSFCEKMHLSLYSALYMIMDLASYFFKFYQFHLSLKEMWFVCLFVCLFVFQVFYALEKGVSFV